MEREICQPVFLWHGCASSGNDENHRLWVSDTSDLQARAIEPQEVTGHKKGRSSFSENSGLFQNFREIMSVVSCPKSSRCITPEFSAYCHEIS